MALGIGGLPKTQAIKEQAQLRKEMAYQSKLDNFKVSIDTIEEANGLTRNTIYAGKKLVIP